MPWIINIRGCKVRCKNNWSWSTHKTMMLSLPFAFSISWFRVLYAFTAFKWHSCFSYIIQLLSLHHQLHKQLSHIVHVPDLRTPNIRLKSSLKIILSLWRFTFNSGYFYKNSLCILLMLRSGQKKCFVRIPPVMAFLD